MRVLHALGQFHKSSVNSRHRLLQDFIAQVPRVSGIAGARLRFSAAMSSGGLESVLAECIAQPSFSLPLWTCDQGGTSLQI